MEKEAAGLFPLLFAHTPCSYIGPLGGKRRERGIDMEDSRTYSGIPPLLRIRLTGSKGEKRGKWLGWVSLLFSLFRRRPLFFFPADRPNKKYIFPHLSGGPSFFFSFSLAADIFFMKAFPFPHKPTFYSRLHPHLTQKKDTRD